MYTTACQNRHINGVCCNCEPVESPLQQALRERRERIAHLPLLARYEYRCNWCGLFVWSDGETQFLSETTTPCECMKHVIEEPEVPTNKPEEAGENTEWWRK